MSRVRVRFFVAALTCVCAVAAGCTKVEGPNESSPKIKALKLASVPTDLLGLRVQSEDVKASLAKVRRAYVEEAALYSMRNADDLVQATLQVNKFRDESRYESSKFRLTIVNQVGSSQPKKTRMGAHTVWRTTGTKQRVAVWFEGRYMFLLAVREDFDKPRTLMRTAVDVRP